MFSCLPLFRGCNSDQARNCVLHAPLLGQARHFLKDGCVRGRVSQGWRRCAGLLGDTPIPSDSPGGLRPFPMPQCPHSSPLRFQKESGIRLIPSLQCLPAGEVQVATPSPATSPSSDLSGLTLRSPAVQQGHSKSAEDTTSSWACPRDGTQKWSGCLPGVSPRCLQPLLCPTAPKGSGALDPKESLKLGTQGGRPHVTHAQHLPKSQPPAQVVCPHLPGEPEGDLTFTKAAPM